VRVCAPIHVAGTYFLGLGIEAKGGSMDMLLRRQESQERLAWFTSLAIIGATLITVAGSLLTG
jgi:hypothetical protein